MLEWEEQGLKEAALESAQQQWQRSKRLEILALQVSGQAAEQAAAAAHKVASATARWRDTLEAVREAEDHHQEVGVQPEAEVPCVDRATEFGDAIDRYFDLLDARRVGWSTQSLWRGRATLVEFAEPKWFDEDDDPEDEACQPCWRVAWPMVAGSGIGPTPPLPSSIPPFIFP
jgi:hypothetical protein